MYEDIPDVEALKRHMRETLEDYNSTPGVIYMDLVLFRDAIEHSKFFIPCIEYLATSCSCQM